MSDETCHYRDCEKKAEMYRETTIHGHTRAYCRDHDPLDAAEWIASCFSTPADYGGGENGV